MDIIPNLRKISFDDHDMKNHRDLDCQKYMDIVQDTPEAPKRFFEKEWARGLEQSGRLSLLYMPHFGRIAPLNTHVKQLLVFFHNGF